MSTEVDVTVWLTPESKGDIHVAGNTAWATIDNVVVFHVLSSKGPLNDLNVLEGVFARGLEAIQEAQQRVLLASMCTPLIES